MVKVKLVITIMCNYWCLSTLFWMKQCDCKYVRVTWQTATLFSLDLWNTYCLGSTCVSSLCVDWHTHHVLCIFNLKAVILISSLVTMANVCQEVTGVMVSMTVLTTVMKLDVRWMCMHSIIHCTCPRWFYAAHLTHYCCLERQGKANKIKSQHTLTKLVIFWLECIHRISTRNHSHSR